MMFIALPTQTSCTIQGNNPSKLQKELAARIIPQKWVTSWRLNQPIWKICGRQIGSYPQSSGWTFKKMSCHHPVFAGNDFRTPNFWVLKTASAGKQNRITNKPNIILYGISIFMEYVPHRCIYIYHAFLFEKIPTNLLTKNPAKPLHLGINVETCQCVVGCVRNKVLISHLQHPKPKDVQPSSRQSYGHPVVDREIDGVRHG